MYDTEPYVLYILSMELYALQSHCQLVLLVLLLKKESFKTNLAVSNFFSIYSYFIVVLAESLMKIINETFSLYLKVHMAWPDHRTVWVSTS